MTYSFLQDTEPSEAQLKKLMQEVGEEVRKRREKADDNFDKLIRKEIELAAQRNPFLPKK